MLYPLGAPPEPAAVDAANATTFTAALALSALAIGLTAAAAWSARARRRAHPSKEPDP
jgi:hypothetical protein